MKKRLYTLATILLIAMLATSTVSAGGGLKISGFSLGSLILKGYTYGNNDYHVQLDASGFASIICTNPGSNDVPGQSYPHVSGNGAADVFQNFSKNGKVTFSVIAKPIEESPNYVVAWDVAGCPNPNWTARMDFVYWTNAIVKVTEIATGATSTYTYKCTTTRIPKNDGYTFDDGTVSCVLQ